MTAIDTRRIAIVTGGAGALGRWVVRELVAADLSVHVPVRSSGSVDPLRSFLEGELGAEAAARARPGPCDVTEASDVEGFVDRVVAEEGRLDILINGVGGFATSPLEETSPGAWREMMEGNATSAFLCSRAAAPVMKERGWGRIVNVASFPALERGAERMSAYAASKAALLNLTRSLAKELLGNGITVNAVVPRIIDTPANRDAMPDADRSTWIHPAEIARVMAFLAGDDAGIVTGAAIPLEKG